MTLPKPIKLKARLNHGRWIADCPICKGAELVEAGKPFVCYSCFPQLRPGFFPKIRGEIVTLDKPAGYAEYTVAFPTNKTDIETAVQLRKVPNKNWVVGETAITLNAENTVHGIVAVKEQ